MYNLETLETYRTKERFLNPRNSTWFQQRNSDQRTPTKTRIVFPHHKYHARTNAVSTRTRIVFPHHKHVADQEPTDRQFRYSNLPIRCSTQLNRYYGHYHEHLHREPCFAACFAACSARESTITDVIPGGPCVIRVQSTRVDVIGQLLPYIQTPYFLVPR